MNIKVPKFRFVILSIVVTTLLFLPPAHSTEPDSTTSISQLIEDLSSSSFRVRDAAQKGLLKLSTRDVPELRKLLEESEDQEVRWRIELALQKLTRPRWRTDLKQALLDSQDSGKMLMVFSTIGEIKGFS